MKIVLVLLAGGTLLTSLRAAWLWYAASRVNVNPIWAGNGDIEPIDPQQASSEWIVALLQAAQKSSNLNKSAARWTGASAALSASTTIAGLLV